mmetsp:Transcript_10776/g.12807  ORF Transcript_10776/g.12807 Transcript_10776/m.12807 type:complete len:114 (+) Transcript_10776:67-408(+)|eukprot:jgi/Bigna1/51015/estExt_Genewise1.C_1060021
MDQQASIQHIQHITYSTKYQDDTYEYRHVVLPSQLTAIVPRHLLAEHEWRSLGLQQSRGWIHYGFYAPEPNVLLFRRKLPPQQDAEAIPAPATVTAAMATTVNAPAANTRSRS